MTPPGVDWGAYEGPFDTKEEALGYLKQFVNESFSFSPEMLRMVVVRFDGEQVDLVRSESGRILNGEYLYWRLGDD